MFNIIHGSAELFGNIWIQELADRSKIFIIFQAQQQGVLQVPETLIGRADSQIQQKFSYVLDVYKRQG